MPLDRFVLILVLVVIAAGVTVWLATMAAAALEFGAGAWFGFIPAALVGYVVWRVVSDRLSNREDDHYDRIEK
jgi:F0F1-type ATP synthase assembly protein I